MSEPEGEPDPTALLQQLMNAGEMLKGVASVVIGYRQELTRAGIPQHAADLMAVQLHEVLMTRLAAGSASAKPAPPAGHIPGWLKGGRDG